MRFALKSFVSVLIALTLSVPVEAANYKELAKTSFEPLIDINYRPDIDTDEGGLWYKVDKIEEEIKRSPFLIRDPELNNYISDIVCKLSGDYCPHIRVYIIDSPHFNASMYPNGMMHIWTGALLRVANEDQLAAILAHEIAHFLRSHQITQWRKLKSNASAAAVLDTLLAAVTGVYGIASLGFSGSISAFSRTQEAEADIYGLQMLADNNYNPAAAAKLWQYIDKERDSDLSKTSYNAFFASHPEVKNRSQSITKLTSNKARKQSPNDPYKKIVEKHYVAFMQNHLQLQEYEQTASLLERHRKMGYSPAWIDFFSGELYRLRGKDGDMKKAIAAYQKALSADDSIADAMRELAYLYMKTKQNKTALDYFVRYRDSQPEASDKAMVDYYIKQLQGS